MDRRRERALSESGRAMMQQSLGNVKPKSRTKSRKSGATAPVNIPVSSSVSALKKALANDDKTKPKIRWSSDEHRATMRQAVEAVLINGNTTKVAERFNIPARTLRRYVAKEKRLRNGGKGASIFAPKKKKSSKTKSSKKSKKKTQGTIGRDRTASVDFVMKHINASDPGSFVDFFGKDLIMSFGEAAASGRLRTLSAENFGGRARTTSTERFIADKMHKVAPIALHDGTDSSDAMNMDDFEIPVLFDDTQQRRRKRDRNISLEMLGMASEPSAQKIMLSTSPWIAKSPGIGSLLASSPGIFTKNLEELMRHRASTASSLSKFPIDAAGNDEVDEMMITESEVIVPDFGFAFDK